MDGTSGYDFLDEVNRLFVDSRSVAVMRDVYARFTGARTSLESVVYAGKTLIMSTTMASELNVLAEALNRLSERDRRSRDFTFQGLRRTLREIVACFPVYRTYMSEARTTAFDREAVDKAIARARRRNPAMESSIFSFVRSVLLPEGEATEESLRERLRFAMKLQQYTGPVQAKGIEDTAFYRHNVLLSLNEVGADPFRFGSSPREFHQANLRRADEWPRSMLATATHDTKRGEDARVRIALLSEIPDEWEAAVRRWSELNAPSKRDAGGEPAPDANDEYLFYQALLGAWDFAPGADASTLAARISAYLLKAVKEAKSRTSWISPDEEYEAAVAAFVEGSLSRREFLEAFAPFAGRAAALAALHSLTQVVLKAASPGVCDFYQGSEFWDLSFVDPDNRRPVDYGLRRRALADMMTALERPSPEAARELLRRWEDGRVKLYATAAALRLRRRHADLFARGAYLPLEVRGERADRFVAFARELGGERAIVVAPRLIGSLLWKTGPAGLADAAGDAAVVLPAGWEAGLRDAFAGRPWPADGRFAALLRDFPVLLFAGDRETRVP